MYENDSRIIREAQARYAKGRDSGALSEIYKAASRVAAAMIARQCETKGFALSMAQVREKAHDAAAYVAMRFMERDGFLLKKPAGYIHACVMRELYHRKAIDRAAIRKAKEAMEDGV